MLMDVFYHYDCSIHHRANRDRDPSQRHDVGVDPLKLHHDKGHENPDWQTQDYDDRRTEVKQKESADKRNDNELFDQLAFKRFNGAIDQGRTIIGRHNLHALR